MRCVVVTTLALTSSALASNQVLVVGVGQPYTSLQVAIDAAADGDVILVKEGHHPSATIDGKALTILADDPADLGFHRIGWIEFKNLPVGSTAHLRGFELNDSGNGYERIRVTGCLGAVHIEDCQVQKSQNAAARVTGSMAVVFSRCVLEGAPGNSMILWNGAPALLATTSNVTVYDSVLAGGDGGDDHNPNQLYPGPPTDGGAGAVVDGGMLFVSGSTLSGGDGGDMVVGFGGGDVCGDGGHGATLLGGALLRRLNSPLLAGPGGTPNYPQWGSPGVGGVTLNAIDGSAQSIAEFARRLEIASPIREADTTLLSISGQPGEACWILFSPVAQPFHSTSLKGTLLPAFPVGLISLGGLSGGGTLSASMPMPADVLPPGIDAVSIHLQGMFAGANSPILLSSPSTFVLVDDAL